MSVLADKRSYMRADDRRAQIVACARSVFARQGFHGANIAAICKEAGIGRGTLYQYFDNKRDVFFAVVEELKERVERVIRERTPIADFEGSAVAPPELVSAYCRKRLRTMLDAVFADEASLRLIVQVARGLDGGLDEVVRQVDRIVLGAYIADLEAAHRMGVIECDNPEMTALFVLGGVEKLVLTALARDEDVDLDAIVHAATRLQLFGLMTRNT